MKYPVVLDQFISGAPKAQCCRYDTGDIIVCMAKGKARNLFYFRASVPAVALETDGASFRFPPNETQGVCDWCVFTVEGLRGYFVELKGSDFEHAVLQLSSTMYFMSRNYGIVPKKAFPVLSGSHPSNSRPGKANVKARFKRQWPGVELRECSSGNINKPEALD